MFRSIAITTDFSDLSFGPFATAAALAREFGAKVYLLHVTAEEEICTPWQVPESHTATSYIGSTDCKQRLERLVRRTPSLRHVDVSTLVLEGRPEVAIEAFRKRHHVDLLTIATSGHEGVESFLLGSFTARILHGVGCSVLVFPEYTRDREPYRDEVMPRRLLAPYDFSQASKIGVDTAFQWARFFRAHARLLYVVEETSGTQGYLAGTCDSVAEYFERVRAEGERRLRELIAEEWHGVEAEATARIGQPTAEILREASDFEADWIVMSSRGLSDLGQLHMGSVAERTIQGSYCPILVV